eukprot:gene6262-29263_t
MPPPCPAIAALDVSAAVISGTARCGNVGNLEQMRFQIIGGVASLCVCVERLAATSPPTRYVWGRLSPRWGARPLADAGTRAACSAQLHARLCPCRVEFAKIADQPSPS